MKSNCYYFWEGFKYCPEKSPLFRKQTRTYICNYKRVLSTNMLSLFSGCCENPYPTIGDISTKKRTKNGCLDSMSSFRPSLCPTFLVISYIHGYISGKVCTSRGNTLCLDVLRNQWFIPLSNKTSCLPKVILILLHKW